MFHPSSLQCHRYSTRSLVATSQLFLSNIPLISPWDNDTAYNELEQGSLIISDSIRVIFPFRMCVSIYSSDVFTSGGFKNVRTVFRGVTASSKYPQQFALQFISNVLSGCFAPENVRWSSEKKKEKKWDVSSGHGKYSPHVACRSGGYWESRVDWSCWQTNPLERRLKNNKQTYSWW